MTPPKNEQEEWDEMVRSLSSEERVLMVTDVARAIMDADGSTLGHFRTQYNDPARDVISIFGRGELFDVLVATWEALQESALPKKVGEARDVKPDEMTLDSFRQLMDLVGKMSFDDQKRVLAGIAGLMAMQRNALQFKVTGPKIEIVVRRQP